MASLGGRFIVPSVAAATFHSCAMVYPGVSLCFTPGFTCAAPSALPIDRSPHRQHSDAISFVSVATLISLS